MTTAEECPRRLQRAATDRVLRPAEWGHRNQTATNCLDRPCFTREHFRGSGCKCRLLVFLGSLEESGTLSHHPRSSKWWKYTAFEKSEEGGVKERQRPVSTHCLQIRRHDRDRNPKGAAVRAGFAVRVRLVSWYSVGPPKPPGTRHSSSYIASRRLVLI